MVKPHRSPLELLAGAVIKGTVDVEKEIRRLRAEAEREALREAAERWRRRLPSQKT